MRKQMIGSRPTVGCLVFLQESRLSLALSRVLAALQTALPVTYRSRVENKWLITATLGASEVESLLFALESEGQTVVFIEFDEEATVKLADRLGQTLEAVLSPYADALKQIPDAVAIGIGFEMAVPTGLNLDALQEAGVAILFERNQSSTGWQQRNVYHLTGHTERPLVGAV